MMKQEKVMGDLDKVISKLADLFPYGHLQASIKPTEFLSVVTKRIIELETVAQAANNLSAFIAANEYPEPMSEKFTELTRLADIQDTVVRKYYGITSRKVSKEQL